MQRYNPKKVRREERRDRESHGLYQKYIEPHVMTTKKLNDARSRNLVYYSAWDDERSIWNGVMIGDQQ